MGNQSTALRPEVLSDLKESTAFSAEEIRAYYKEFLKECDAHRMTVDEEAFKQIYIKVFPGGDPTGFAAQVFRVFDTDKNGRLDFHEFMLAISIQQKGSTEDRLGWLFNMFDLDGTGYISMDELTTLVEALRKLHGRTDPRKAPVSTEEVAHHIMIKADKDRDQQLSLREFIDGATTSTTMEHLLQGALRASSSPFSIRKRSTTKKPSVH